MGISKTINFRFPYNHKTYLWVHHQAERHGWSLSEEIRHQLELAMKYEKAIQEAENAPIHFVRSRY